MEFLVSEAVSKEHGAIIGIDQMRKLGMLEDPLKSGGPHYSVPCVGTIGDSRPILEVELNGTKTTMLFPNSESNCIPEDQVKEILPSYLTALRRTQARLYWNISGENMGEVDLELKVGFEKITAPFCVVKNAKVKEPHANTSGHVLIGGNDLQAELKLVMGHQERQMYIKKKKPVIESLNSETGSRYSVPCVGPIGDDGPILLVELNGTKTTMLFSSDSKSSSIPEDLLNKILPSYMDFLRSSPNKNKNKKKLKGKDKKNIGEVDLELKVGAERILATFCVMRDPVVKFPAGSTFGHRLIGGAALLAKLGMVKGPGPREMSITPKRADLHLL